MERHSLESRAWGDCELDWIDSHLRARFRCDSEGRFEASQVPSGSAPPPRFYFARTRVGTLWRFHTQTPSPARRRLARYAAREAALGDLNTHPERLDAMLQALGEREPEEARKHSVYREFVFCSAVDLERGPTSHASNPLALQIEAGWRCAERPSVEKLRGGRDLQLIADAYWLL
jgi:hypothetical protein